MTRNALKKLALSWCLDIYNDYDESEIKNLPASVQGAWDIGKRLVEAMTEKAT